MSVWAVSKWSWKFSKILQVACLYFLACAGGVWVGVRVDWLSFLGAWVGGWVSVKWVIDTGSACVIITVIHEFVVSFSFIFRPFQYSRSSISFPFVPSHLTYTCTCACACACTYTCTKTQTAIYKRTQVHTRVQICAIGLYSSVGRACAS